MQNTKQKKDQHGVALLFSIGIVALMMMLVITYVSTAMTERDVSQNSKNQYAAKLIAESAVQNVLAKLRYMTNNYNVIKTESLVSFDSTAPAIYDDIEKLIVGHPAISNRRYDDLYQYLKGTAVTRLAYDTAFTYSSENSSANGVWKAVNNLNETSTRPGWQYVKDSDNYLIGRYAYVAFKPKGLLDPFTMPETTAADPDSWFYPKSISGKTIDSITRNNAPTINTFDWNAFLLNTYPTSLTDEQKNKLLNRYLKIPRPPKRGEVFWYSSSASGSPTLYKRFNLCRNDWNTLTVAELTNTSNLRKSTESDQTKCIPWLSSGSNKEQIAANLIAFMAGVYNSTTDYYSKLAAGTLVNSSLLNATDSATYFANLRVPYLNEIGIKLTYSVALVSKTSSTEGVPPESPPGTEITTYKYKLEIKPEIYYEFINYYTQPSREYKISSLTLSVTGFKTNSGVNAIFPDKTFADCTKTIPEKTFSVTNAGFYVVKIDGDPIFSEEFETTEIDETKATVYIPKENLKISFANNAKIYCNTPPTQIVDFCKTKNLNGQTVTRNSDIVLRNNTSESEFCYYIDWQAKDARNNLNADNWITFSKENASDAITFVEGDSPVGNPNNVATENADNADNLLNYTATNVQPTTTPSLSNFHPGMLGFVHRGTNWQTLNLVRINMSKIAQYNDSTVYYDYEAMGDYANGDANLLNQVCWDSGDLGYAYGKLNLNAISAYNNDYPIQGYGKLINFNAAEQMIKTSTTTSLGRSIAYQVDAYMQMSNQPRYLKTRSGMVERVASLYSSSKKNDVEEIIGKRIFLTEAEEAPFEVGDTVIIVALAQTIQEAKAAKVPYKKADGSIVLIDTAKGVWNPGADQITATQRVIAILQKDNTEKWKIVRIIYVD